MVFICNAENGLLTSDNIEVMQGENNATSIIIDGLGENDNQEVFIDMKLPKSIKYRAGIGKNAEGKYEYFLNNLVTKNHGLINYEIIVIGIDEKVEKYQAVNNILVKKAVNAVADLPAANDNIIDKLIADNLQLTQHIDELTDKKEDKYVLIYDKNNPKYDLGMPQGILPGGNSVSIDLTMYDKIKFYTYSANNDITVQEMEINAAILTANKAAVASKSFVSVWREDNTWKMHHKVASFNYDLIAKSLTYIGSGYINFDFSTGSLTYNDRSIHGLWADQYIIFKMEGLLK